jgi:soluble lytic murein transglycosylase-like protein
VAGHRSPSGRRARPEVVPVRGGAAHRAPGTGHLRVHVLAAAAAVGAVATGTLTALLPGTPTPTEAPVVDGVGGPVLAASAGVLRDIGRTTAATPTETMIPVAYGFDEGDRDAATEQRVASVEKAGRLAAQLADLHAQEQRRARTSALIRGGGLDGWIAEALKIMNLPQDLAPGVKQIILSESGGNPRAVNTWDSNARRGTPSQGLMQTIPATFRAFVHPDVAGRPINDPVANITAGVRYMIDRYGVDTVRAGGRSSAAGNYLGY